jgi:hypothetical protein
MVRATRKLWRKESQVICRGVFVQSNTLNYVPQMIIKSVHFP